MSDKLFGGATAAALKGVLDEILEGERQMPKWFKAKVAPVPVDYELQMQTYPTTWGATNTTNTTELNLQSVGTGTVAIGDVVGPVYKDGVPTTAPVELNDGRVFKYDPSTLKWGLLEGPAMAKKKPVCTCGGQKYGGGTCSHWCDLNE